MQIIPLHPRLNPFLPALLAPVHVEGSKEPVDKGALGGKNATRKRPSNPSLAVTPGPAPGGSYNG